MGLYLLFGFLAISLVSGERNVTLLYSDIVDLVRETSDPDVIPVTKRDNLPVEVKLGVNLLYIGQIDEQADLIELVLEQKHIWTNPALTWDERNPDLDVDNVTVPLRYLWIPDIIVSNAVNSPDIVTPELATVSSDGKVLYAPQVLYRLHTDLSGLQSPSGVNVTLRFESWTYDKAQLTLATPTTNCFTIDDFESRKFQVTNPTISPFIQQVPYRRFDVHVYSFILKKLTH